VPDVNALRDGKLTPDDTLLPGVTLQLRDGLTGQRVLGSAALPGFYAPNQPITTITDANGHYAFGGLPPGVYGVFDVKPAGYLTGIETPGSLGGVVISTLVVTDPAVLAVLLAPPQDDAIVQIQLLAGYQSVDNNFSVVTTVTPPPQVQVFVFPQAPVFAAGAAAAPFLPPTLTPLAPPLTPVPLYLAPYIRREGGDLYTWHLSVVDAGQPRGLPDADSLVQLTAMRPSNEPLWQDDELAEGEWTLATGFDLSGITDVRKVRFGIRGGIPVTGDFNGDGKFEVGFFKNGEWFIDLNDNGIWDAGDLRAKLGHKGDRPVTGDWDGDGKTDIGIYGQAWPGDPAAVVHEPGLPDPQNQNTGVPKNMPREPHHMTMGKRTMKLTSTGRPRADLIDHVFFYGLPGDHPVVGDWNGDGTDTIAVFRDGKWFRDIDGDGKWSKTDFRANFGQPGDMPVVGDFNGDGVDELGIFRDGTWYIDTNGNGMIDEEDQIFQLGGPRDIPVVGDFNGDGKSEPGVYHAASTSPTKTSAK
jgi:hypothetical protein